jgi:hypothetical protein
MGNCASTAHTQVARVEEKWGSAFHDSGYSAWSVSTVPHIDIELTRLQLKFIMGAFPGYQFEIPLPLLHLINEYAAEVFFVRFSARCSAEWLSFVTPHILGHIDFDRKLFMLGFVRPNVLWTPGQNIFLASRSPRIFRPEGRDPRRYLRKVLTRPTLKQTLQAAAFEFRSFPDYRLCEETIAIAEEFDTHFLPAHVRKRLEHAAEQARTNEEMKTLPADLRRLVLKGVEAETEQVRTALMRERHACIHSFYDCGDIEGFVLSFPSQ